MEKRTKHRILGGVVIIALIIIILPFFQNKKEFSTPTNLVQAPPFPYQTLDSTSHAEMTISQKQNDPVSSVNPSVIQSKKSNSSIPPNPKLGGDDNRDKAISLEKSHTDSRIKKAIQIIKTHKIKSNSILIHKVEIENDGLTKLKDSAWVIQMGSFKSKMHALRLVNQLRANGYRAFIQQVSTAFGESTRVFVGPENKQTSARALASKLETDMKLHGVVISYKPLAL